MAVSKDATSRKPNQDPALQLKSAPPRAVRGFLDRERLTLTQLEMSGARATVLLAPAGFGKTSQLIQWRREALAKGGLAFWHSLDSRDEPGRFVRGLAWAAKSSCGKRGFAESLIQWIEDCSDPLEAMTGWLAEIAELSVDVTLLLDDVHLLPSSTSIHMLPYLLGNAPANLHIALAARPTSALMASGTLGTTPVARVTASDLRFRAEETMGILAAALGGAGSSEAGLHLHELTEGWPLGVQLAVAALRRSGDLEGLVSSATADIRHYFVDTLIDHQSTDAAHLLIRLAQFDLIHPELCSAVLDQGGIAEVLLLLQDETPLFLRAEGSDWMRLHPLAREVLGERLALLPEAERQAMSRKASAWFAANELFEEAAKQSFLAGDTETAIGLIEQQTYSMTTQGRGATVLAWYQRLSPEEIQQRPAFWIPVAWALAMSERPSDAAPMIDLVESQPNSSPEIMFEAAMIRATAASHSDRADVAASLMAQWPEAPLKTSSKLLPVYYAAKAYDALLNGQPDQARLEIAPLSALDPAQSYSPMAYGYVDLISGLSYVWEGRCALAEQVLRPALIRAESQMGRRNPVTSMLAALLAYACWECGKNDDPVDLLAGRLVVIERQGLPDALIVAYKVLAWAADRGGRQDLALSRLEALLTIGQARAIPRLQAVALYELVRLHARRGRTETARNLSAQLDGMASSGHADIPRQFIPWIRLHADLARAHVSLAYGDKVQALAAVDSAARLAMDLKRGRDLVEARLLRAEALRRLGSPDAQMVLGEAVSLAQANGMLDAIREYNLSLSASEANEELLRLEALAPIGRQPKESPALGSGLLTAKEREVLDLVSRGLSNKEIARALNIGEQTIKWHMKNLFGKLNAASRKHMVARAKMLGLIDA